MSGGGGNDSTVTTVAVPAYLMAGHHMILDELYYYIASGISDSPYNGYEALDFDSGFFGSGLTLLSFPSLFGTYVQLITSVNLNSMFNNLCTDSASENTIGELVARKSEMLSEELEEEAEPKYLTGMRDINSVMSSSFIIGRTMMESRRIKELSKFESELRYKMIQVGLERFKIALQWKKDSLMTYAEIFKLYLTAKLDMDGHNYGMAAKKSLWPFTLWEYYRVALGSVTTGSSTRSTAPQGTSTTASALGGALTGAAAGATVGGVPGAIIGGVLGLAMGLL